MLLSVLIASAIAAVAPFEQTVGARLPSLVVAVRHADGAHDVRAYGRLDDDKAPDGDTAYEMGSITKTFTALLLADSVATQRFRYATTLGSSLALPKDAASSSITFEQLATHTSGLPRLPPNLRDAKSPADDPYKNYTPAFLVDALAKVKLDERVVEYSNFGFGALGYALTNDRGGYTKALGDDVITPLALQRTRVGEPPPATRVATPTSKGKPVTPWHKTEATIGAGGVWSTANDLLRMSDLYVDAQRGRLGDDVPAALKTALVDVFKQRVAAVEESHLFGLFKTKRPAIALAWHIRRDGVRWHNGGTGGTSTMWLIDPKSGCAAIALANAEDAHDDIERVAIEALDACRSAQR